MKKTVLFISMLAYLCLTAGVSVNLHYCMDRLDSAMLFSEAKASCSKCGMPTAKGHGCCRDEVQVLKIDDDQRAAQTIAYDFGLAALPVSIPSFYLNLPLQSSLAGTQTALPPPLPDQVDACIINCVFRI